MGLILASKKVFSMLLSAEAFKWLFDRSSSTTVVDNTDRADNCDVVYPCFAEWEIAMIARWTTLLPL